MVWTRIINRFGGRKKRKAEILKTGEPPPEQLLREYLWQLAEEMNYRLLCEMTDQVLWVESITVTACEYGADSGQKEPKKAFCSPLRNIMCRESGGKRGRKLWQ